MSIKNAFLLLAACMLLLAGCAQQGGQGEPGGNAPAGSDPKPSAAQTQPKQPTAAKEKSQEPAKQMEITIYYPDEGGIKLVAVKRTIEAREQDKYKEAVKALLQMPRETGLTAIFPKKTKIRSIEVENGTATVDFDSSMVKGFVGGSTGEELLVGSLVNTLTNFPEIQSVRILIDGKQAESLSGHMDLTAPLRRMPSLLK